MTESVNSSEQFVFDVCQKSFLSLWSYANPQGQKPGKELCDILVVCAPHVLVISVKEVALKDSADVGANRWQRKAIEESKKQIKGAIRWLDNANSVTNKNGERGLPLPSMDQRVYHRIAVAFGGQRKVPISISRENAGETVHVFDERSFYLLLQHLDTITDFVQYLSDKEKFLSRTEVVISGGEENLLAIYLHNGRTFPKERDLVVLEGDLWDGVSSKPEFLAKLNKDQVSYIWDHLIESLCKGGFEGKNWLGPGLAESEQALRVLASEDRFARRMLGSAFRNFLELSKAGQVRSRRTKSLSCVVYVFFAYDSDSSLEERQRELLGRCFASLCRFPECFTVIGIGINIPGQTPQGGYSTDLVMLHTDQGEWPEEYLEKARFARDRLGYFKTPNETRLREDEYPTTYEDRNSRRDGSCGT